MATVLQDRDDPQLALLLSAASEAQRRGDAGSATRHFEQALRRDPGNAIAHNALGMQALARSDLEAAARHFRAAAESDPSAPALWMNLATACRQGGDDAGERAGLLRTLDLDQRHFMANIRLAELHERLGEAPQAALRWSLVLGFAEQVPDLPPGLEVALAHARDFVAAHRRKFAEVVDTGLELSRANHAVRERRRFDACVDAMLGRRRIYRNECDGLHFPFLPADEFFDREHFPWMDRIEAETSVIRAELEALLAERPGDFSPYVSMAPGSPANIWSPLDDSPDWSAYFLWHQGERIDEACRRCPRTAAILESLPRAEMPNRAPTAFFSILRPGSRIPAHTGVSNIRAIVHLPLIVPPSCGFRVGGEAREWRVGKAFAFDDTIEHEAWNDSDAPRAILIFDVWNPWLSEAERHLLRTFFDVAETCGLDPSAAGMAD